jgi:hypothetical protein
MSSPDIATVSYDDYLNNHPADYNTQSSKGDPNTHKPKPSEYINLKCPKKFPKNCTDTIWTDYWQNPDYIDILNPCVKRDTPCSGSSNDLRKKYSDIIFYPCEVNGEGDDCLYPSKEDYQNKIKRINNTLDRIRINRLQTRSGKPFDSSHDDDDLQNSLNSLITPGGKHSKKNRNKRRKSRKL